MQLEPNSAANSDRSKMECMRAVTYTEFFGGHSEEAPPVPIPNTEVKLFSADGTAWETMWESRSPPSFL